MQEVSRPLSQIEEEAFQIAGLIHLYMEQGQWRKAVKLVLQISKNNQKKKQQ